MIYGLYLSAQGADVQARRLDVISNNLANASTTAFKRDLALVQSHPPFAKINPGQSDPERVAQVVGGTTLAGIATDLRDGSLNETGSPFDFALSGHGFFRVSDGDRDYLTRAGNFALTTQGEIVTQDGQFNLMNTSGGKLNIPPGVTKIQVGSDGTVTGFSLNSDEPLNLGRIDVVVPESPGQLKKYGENYYTVEGEVNAAGGDVSIRQGFLEASGTRPMQEMIEMIETSRALEMNINTIRLQDESLARLLQAMPNR